MNAIELVDSLRAQGFSLTPLPEGKLAVRPAERITEELRQSIRAYKAEIVATLTRPHLNARGELIIPFESDSRFHWWRPDGQSIRTTLIELGAPPEVLIRYVETDTLRVRQ